MLAQPSCHFVRVGSLSLWHGFDMARSLLVTLGLSDGSPCVAVLILKSLAQLLVTLGNNLTGGDRESWGLLDSPKGSRCEREGRTMALLERCWLPFVFVYYVSVLMCIVNCLHVVHVKMFKGRTSKPCPGERVEAQQTVQITHKIKQYESDFLKLASGGYVFTKSRGLDRT